jgi:hypothetical protein
MGIFFEVKTTVRWVSWGGWSCPNPLAKAIGIFGRTNVTIAIVSGTAQIPLIDRRNGPVTRCRGRAVYAGPSPPKWGSGEAGFPDARRPGPAMNRFIDASVLVEACLADSRNFTAADALVKRNGAVTSAHALAEACPTLSGDARLKIKADDAAQRSPIWRMRIHARAARETNCAEIRTLKVPHLEHVAPDLSVKRL